MTKLPVHEGPSVLERMRGILGLRQLRTDRDLVKVVERRLPIRAIDALRRSGLTDAEIYSVVIPRRTLIHRRARRERLTHSESDRAVRLARIAAQGERIFGKRERFWHWLRTPKRRFQDRTPLQFIATEAGARLVEEWLDCIDNGMAA